MAHFDKTSSEYKDNGQYEIDGVEYMSIWAFKKRHNISPNDKDSNGSEGRELTSKCKDIHSSSPDFGGFNKIFLYKVSDLEDYYGG